LLLALLGTGHFQIAKAGSIQRANLQPENPDKGSGTNMDFESSSSLYVSSVGEATLVGEIFDSTTGEIIARFVERHAARQAVGGVQGSRSSGWREIMPGIERWGANRVRTWTRSTNYR